jgi:hypothetical protein
MPASWTISQPPNLGLRLKYSDLGATLFKCPVLRQQEEETYSRTHGEAGVKRVPILDGNG